MSKPQSGQAELNTASAPKPIKISSEEINKIEQYAKEFNIPAELKEELMEAVIKGTVDTQWGKDEISKKEIDDAGLSLKKIAKQKSDSKTENLAAGYRVSGASFNKMLAACLSAKDDNEQTKDLKNQALAMLKFSELAKGNYPDIPETPVPDIPETQISDIPEMPRMPMIDLEHALSLIDEGRIDEALKIIDEDISQNQDDREFVEIAEALRENIKKYE